MHPPLFKIRDNGYFGFINAEGEVIIEPQFLDVDHFRNGYTSVQLNGQRALLDHLGRLYVRRLYRSIGIFQGRYGEGSGCENHGLY
ncbi:MAG: WG repeat-containing protein [Saprospiraceae bacterium]